jgi:hypothetical protein
LKRNLTIEHKGLVLELSVEPIERVFPHEEVLPEILKAIGDSLEQAGVQFDPIIVDRSTGVALDGMHRVEALRKMGASKILVCRVDYSDDSIRLSRWLRAFDGMSNPLLEDLKVRLDLTRVNRAEAMSEVEGHRTPVALFANGISFKSLMPFRSVRESIELVRVFDQTASRCGITPRILSEGEAARLIRSGAFVFVPPSPSKADVVQSGLDHHLFPPKSTRHMIPARPVGVAFPLEWLMDAHMSAREANDRLSSLVAGSNVVALHGGSKYQGRVYEEPLYRYTRKAKGS